MPRAFDLQHRLLEYAASIIRFVESFVPSRSGNHVGGQLLRSGTSPLGNHAEAQAAESVEDFVHKMSICHKELRESLRWIHLAKLVPLVEQAGPADRLLRETDELIRIFHTSIETARSRKKDKANGEH